MTGVEVIPTSLSTMSPHPAIAAVGIDGSSWRVQSGACFVSASNA